MRGKPIIAPVIPTHTTIHAVTEAIPPVLDQTSIASGVVIDLAPSVGIICSFTDSR